MVSGVLLHESTHILKLDVSVTEKGWHFFKIGVKMIDFQKAEKCVVQHSIEDGGFFGDPTMLPIEGRLTLSHELFQFRV